MTDHDADEPGFKADRAPPGTWRTRLTWFVGLWFAGVLTVTVVAYGIRAMIL